MTASVDILKKVKFGLHYAPNNFLLRENKTLFIAIKWVCWCYIYGAQEMSVYCIMSEPDFILDGFLCDSLSIGDSSYPQLGSPQEPPQLGTVHFWHFILLKKKKTQTLKGTQTYLVNKNSRVSIIC